MPLRCVALAACVLVAGAACSRARPAVSGALVDRTSTLDDEARRRVERYLAFVQREHGIDYRVVIAGEGEPEVEAERLFRELRVGEEHDGRGLLLWLDPARRRARVEVGYALEEVVPDVSAAWIVEAYLGPRVRSGEVGASVEAAVEGLVERIRPRLAELADAPPASGSGGAGAQADVAMEPDAPAGGPRPEELVPQADPRATRELELALMRAGRYEPEWTIYDDEWRRTRRRGSWSPERLREIARRFDRPYEVTTEGDHAVAWYTDAPDLGPTLLRREPQGWVIDATTGARLVVYDYSNTSWYAVDEPGPYLDLLQRVYRLERVQLQGGRSAWMIAR